MTVVHVDLRHPAPGGGLEPADGALVVRPHRRLVIGNAVVLPDEYVVLLDDGRADLDLTPTGSGDAWVVTERTRGGTTRTVEVPDSGPVSYIDLLDVDPASLDR